MTGGQALKPAPLQAGPAFGGFSRAVVAAGPGAPFCSERMFCNADHERVEWSRTYPAWENCWYCGQKGQLAYEPSGNGYLLRYVEDGTGDQ